MPMRAEQLCFAYVPGRPVLREVSVTLSPGTMTAILGPNSAGKSTLLRLLLGLLTPASGRIVLDEREIRLASRQEFAKRVAYVPQRPEVAFSFSVESVVAMGLYAGDRGAHAPIVRRALERMEIAERAADDFATLSAGQQQRVALARALAQLDAPIAASRLLLADEPVSAMDPKYAVHAMRVLGELRSSNTAVAVVLHDLTLAARFCDHAVLLSEAGRVIAAGETANVLTGGALRAAFDLDFASVPDPASSTAPTLWLALPDRM